MFRRLILRLLILLIVFTALASTIFAQGGPLTYGTVLTDTLNPGTPIIYTFSGTEGDIVTVYAIGSSELQATLSLSNSSGQPIGFSTGDALTPMSNDVRVTAQLPSSDTYIITLNNQSDTAGSFLLSLTVADMAESTALTERTSMTIEPEGTAQQFSIAGNPDIPQVLSIQSLSSSGGFSAQLWSGDGSLLASVAGGLDGITFVLPASTSPYLLKIDADDPSVGSEVELAILAGAAPPPLTTEEAQPVVTDPNACVITASGVNVRSGPSTDFNVIGSLNTGDQLIATGQNSGWYNGTFLGQSAWVAASVVEATGNCNVPVVEAPSAPVAPPPVVTEEAQSSQPSSTPVPTTESSESSTESSESSSESESSPTIEPTSVPFTVVSMSCRWFQNDGATVDFNVTGAAGATFRIDVRQGSTTYSTDRTLNQQGFLNANHRFGQAGNANYTAYIVYNGVDIDSAEC